MCVIVYVVVGFAQVYRYTKDERWLKSGVKMGSVYEYSVISVFFCFVQPVWLCFLAFLFVAWYRGRP